MPASFNWFNATGITPPVKDQGKCGSCWAAAAVGALEIQNVLEGYEFHNLSMQQAVDWFVHFI